MCHRCALSTALDPLSPPPPNISLLGSTVNHMDCFNVRRGGRRKAEMARKPCLILGLISNDRVAKLEDGPWILLNLVPNVDASVRDCHR